jgi:crotonobetainyl-CoA:carnitine CoA-transferase CaiB-like acyl-CoA transferase
MNLFDGIGRPELKSDPRFQSRGQRSQNADALNEIIESWTRTRLSEEVTTELCTKRGVPCVHVRKVSEVLGDPAIRARGAVVGLSHRTRGPIDALAPGMPISFSAARAGYDQPAPDLGTHNAEIYRELLGMSPGEIEELRAKGIV